MTRRDAPQSTSRPADGAGPMRRYDPVAVTLHWVMALGILTLIGIGLVMVHLTLGPSRLFALYQLHKSIGITILIAACLRLMWRFVRPPPPLPPDMAPGERRLAGLAHLALYAEMIGLPLTGWAVVSSSVFAIPTVLFGVIPWPDLPWLSSLPDKKPVEAVFSAIHAYGAYLLIALIVLHGFAALRHHFVLHDEVLARMLPKFLRRSR
ncbi:cytochrome b [Asaia sp. As-1742]|uniref:cytochrome b n=1 Tax=Asaia sp. As-1742 TaxID=2608325 RepID=UPI001F03F1B7|nr:cytochrome b [Asaia sp. As-1742]